MPSKSTSDLVEALQRKESPYESPSSAYSDVTYGKPSPLYPELQEGPVSEENNLTSSSTADKLSKTLLTVSICGSLLYAGYYFYRSYAYKKKVKQRKELLSKIEENLTKVENNFSKLENKLNDIEKQVTILIRRKNNKKYTEDYIQNINENFDSNSSSAKDANLNVSSYYHFDSQGKKFNNKWDTFDADVECAKIDVSENDSFDKNSLQTGSISGKGSSSNDDSMQKKADLRNQIAYIMNVTEKQQSFLDGISFDSFMKDETVRVESITEGGLVKELNQEESIAIQVENLKFRRKQSASRSNKLLDRIDGVVKSFEEL